LGSLDGVVDREEIPEIMKTAFRQGRQRDAACRMRRIMNECWCE
jgi:hypothetical protein